jgi:hypothetical protein
MSDPRFWDFRLDSGEFVPVPAFERDSSAALQLKFARALRQLRQFAKTDPSRWAALGHSDRDLITRLVVRSLRSYATTASGSFSICFYDHLSLPSPPGPVRHGVVASPAVAPAAARGSAPTPSFVWLASPYWAGISGIVGLLGLYIALLALCVTLSEQPQPPMIENSDRSEYRSPPTTTGERHDREY